MIRANSARTASGSPCGIYLKKKNWNTGFNNFGTDTEFALALGIASTEIDVGKPGFIDSRYVAFREAWMQANTQMAAHLEQKIRSEASSRLAPGKSKVIETVTAYQKAKELKLAAKQIKNDKL